MAIDSSLFVVDIPAGTYAVGDTLTLNIKAGPSVVRSGRGAALLKRVTTGLVGSASGSVSAWKISVKNSDWVDAMTSVTASLTAATALDERTGCIQRGNDCPLTPNSSWEVTAECVYGGTTTVDNSLFALIDIDYPAVSSIIDPDALPGIPATVEYGVTSINYNALGTAAASNWEEVNVDFLKAGYEYALQKLEMYVGITTTAVGFVALANAAGMAGLCRIMPICGVAANIRNKVEYASKLVKGPMDIKFLMFVNAGTGTSGSANVMLDFVKRRI